jgi:hypothetical protein
MLYFLIAFFVTFVIAWYLVVFLVPGGLKIWDLFMREGVLAFGTQLHSRISSTRSVFWEQRGDYRHCGGRLQKIQSVSIGAVSSRRIAFTKNVSVFTLIVGSIGLLEKQHVLQSKT